MNRFFFTRFAPLAYIGFAVPPPSRCRRCSRRARRSSFSFFTFFSSSSRNCLTKKSWSEKCVMHDSCSPYLWYGLALASRSTNWSIHSSFGGGCASSRVACSAAGRVCGVKRLLVSSPATLNSCGWLVAQICASSSSLAFATASSTRASRSVTRCSRCLSATTRPYDASASRVRSPNTSWL